MRNKRRGMKEGVTGVWYDELAPLPLHALRGTGDKGQRYQVEAFGYPLDEKWNVIGWSTNLDGAEQMRDAILLAPSCSQARIVDRNAPLEGSPDRHLRQR